MKYEVFKKCLEEALKSGPITCDHTLRIPDNIELTMNGDSMRILNDTHEEHKDNIKQLRLDPKLGIFRFWNPYGKLYMFSIDAITAVLVEYRNAHVDLNQKGVKYDPYARFFETYKLCEIPESDLER